MDHNRATSPASPPPWLDSVNALRVQGRALFDKGRFQDSCDAYSQALDVLQSNSSNPSEHPKLASILLSNRAACRAKLEEHQLSLDDALHAIRLNPTWPKAHSRAAAACTLLGDFKGALVHYTTAASLANHPQYRDGILACLDGILAACYEPPQLDTTDETTLLRCPLSGDTLHKPVTQYLGLSVSKLCMQVAPAFVHGQAFFPQSHWDVHEPTCDVALNNLIEHLHPRRTKAQSLGCELFTRVLKAVAVPPQAATQAPAAQAQVSTATPTSASNSRISQPAPSSSPSSAQLPKRCALLMAGPLFPLTSDSDTSSSNSRTSSGSGSGGSAEDELLFGRRHGVDGGDGRQQHGQETETAQEGAPGGERADGMRPAHQNMEVHGVSSSSSSGTAITLPSQHSTSERSEASPTQANASACRRLEALFLEARALCERNPSPFSFLALAKVLQHQGALDQAVEALSKGLQQFPRSGLVALLKAECELMQGNAVCLESLLRAAQLHCRPTSLPSGLVDVWLRAVAAGCTASPGTREFEEQAGAVVCQNLTPPHGPGLSSGMSADTDARLTAGRKAVDRTGPHSKAPQLAGVAEEEQRATPCTQDVQASRGSGMDESDDDDGEDAVPEGKRQQEMQVDEDEEEDEDAQHVQRDHKLCDGKVGVDEGPVPTSSKEGRPQPASTGVSSSPSTDRGSDLTAAKPAAKCSDGAPVSVRDVECHLCYSLLVEPVTTPCGHCFCRVCLHRALDHSPACPVCRTTLRHLLARHELHTSQVLQALLRRFFKEEYEAREQQLQQELEEQNTHLPIFVCMMSLPGWPCHLHVFEPRYRLMIRRCLESGQRRFGMCQHTSDGPAEYGVVLSIDRCEVIEDGRSLLETTATRRFRILEADTRDDYIVAKVEYIEDEPQDPEERDAGGQTYEELVEQARGLGASLMRSIPAPARGMLTEHFGQLPDNDDHLAFWLAGVLQLDPAIQYNLLRSTSRLERLSSVLSLGRGPRCSIM